MRYAVVLYTDTTSKEAVADFAEQYRRRKQRERRRQQRRCYFIKQRLSGIAMAKEEDEATCYKRAIEELKNYENDRKDRRNERKAG